MIDWIEGRFTIRSGVYLEIWGGVVTAQPLQCEPAEFTVNVVHISDFGTSGCGSDCSGKTITATADIFKRQ